LNWPTGRTLASIDPAEAEALLRAALAQAAADENFPLAAGTAGVLSNLQMDAGRLREALDLGSQMAQYSRLAGLGPWTQIADQGQQMRILGLMGQHRQVLGQIHELLDKMDKLPATKAGNEAAEPWNVREATLDIGRSSAQALKEWQQCLDFNTAILTSMRAREASAYDIIRVRFDSAAPLIELRRLADAELIVLEAQHAYEDDNDIARLQQVLGTRAALEVTRGRPRQAVELQRTAIRLAYVQPEPRGIAISHHQLAYHLRGPGQIRRWHAPTSSPPPSSSS
jgi:tetratricopeptide (TPR) repeat protein